MSRADVRRTGYKPDTPVVILQQVSHRQVGPKVVVDQHCIDLGVGSRDAVNQHDWHLVLEHVQLGRGHRCRRDDKATELVIERCLDVLALSFEVLACVAQHEQLAV